MPQVEGIAKNIFNIIDAAYYAGRDADNALNSDARGGKYAKVYGPNKLILDTGWSTKNAWIGQHEVNVRWFTDTTAYYGAILEYWIKDSSGNETLAHSPHLHHMNDISDEYGNGAGIAYFNENYQYKLIVRSHPTVAENEYVAVDYVKIIMVDPKSVKSADVYAGSNGAQETPTFRGFYVTVTGNGTSFKYSATYTLPISLTGLYFIPQVCVYGNADGKYLPAFSSYSGNTVTVTVGHVDETVWSGGVVVSCFLLVHEETVSLGGSL